MHDKGGGGGGVMKVKHGTVRSIQWALLNVFRANTIHDSLHNVNCKWQHCKINAFSDCEVNLGVGAKICKHVRDQPF